MNEYLTLRQFDASSCSSSTTSEKLAQIQRQEIEARQETDRIRDAVMQKEAEFKLKRKQMQEQHELQIKHMKSVMCTERSKLKDSERELARCREELEKQIEVEVGVQTVPSKPYNCD